VDAAIETNAKYNYLRNQQLERNDGRVPLMPNERQPTLPALEAIVPPELLNPAKQASPAGDTAAERAIATGAAAPRASDPVAPTTPFGETPAPPPPDEQPKP
jgi:hypothetical protein